ncbi:hypothetical protein J6590_098958 [Homalodisca vitripennis]|nr:hypothetical protein J6590_098958 [Homalodisca vitripennis]
MNATKYRKEQKEKEKENASNIPTRKMLGDASQEHEKSSARGVKSTITRHTITGESGILARKSMLAPPEPSVGGRTNAAASGLVFWP